MIRIYYTDSGHYLLPIGQFDVRNDEEPRLRNAVKKYMRRVFNDTASDSEGESIALQASKTGSRVTMDTAGPREEVTRCKTLCFMEWVDCRALPRRT